MAERSNPGGLTFTAGQVPDNDTVPQPPAEPAPPVSFAERATAAACVLIVIAAIVIGAVR